LQLTKKSRGWDSELLIWLVPSLDMLPSPFCPHRQEVARKISWHVEAIYCNSQYKIDFLLGIVPVVVKEVF
jgi:hypothetical protein